METEQLYVGDKAICPRTNYENDDAAKKIEEMKTILDEIAERVANKLLERSEIAEWARQAEKPAYTASEVGADAAGSASGALTDARAYADSTYMQATGYTDAKIAALINGAPSTLDTLKEIADAMLENENVVEALEAAVGSKASEVEYQAHAANGTVHVTASERDGWNGAAAEVLELAGELEEVRTSFQNGCSVIAGKLTACGVETPGSASPEVMAENIQQMYSDRYNAGVASGTAGARVGNATAAQVLSGKTFTNAQGAGTGTMPDRGAVSQSLSCGGSYTIPAGYHNGSGKVTANSLASQTSANAAAANITNGKTAYVNGVKVTGNGGDNTANYNNGYSAGRTQGRSDVTNSPNSYSLYTKVQYDANYTGGYNAGVTAADNRTNTDSANYKAGYNAGVTAADNRIAIGSTSYKAGYELGYTDGVAAAKKNLQVRAKAHVSEGRQYFYVRVYNTSGWGLMFDNGGNDTLAKDGSGYMTIGTFSA